MFHPPDNSLKLGLFCTIAPHPQGLVQPPAPGLALFRMAGDRILGKGPVVRFWFVIARPAGASGLGPTHWLCLVESGVPPIGLTLRITHPFWMLSMTRHSTVTLPK